MKSFQQFILEDNDVKHGFKMSEHRHDAEYIHEYHKEHSRPTVQTIHHSLLRATQDTVHSKWTPKHSEKSVMPVGILHGGKVHVVDGHHRSEHARKTNGAVKMTIYNHEGHESRFHKWMEHHLK